MRTTAILVLAIAIATLLAAPASSAAFTVTTTADAVDANVGDGTCETAAHQCTLRAAIQEANADTGTADTIVLPAGTYALSLAGDDDTAAAGDLDVRGPTTITGAGQGATILDGANVDRVLDFVGATVSLSGVTVTHGTNSGLRTSNGTVSISNARFTENRSSTTNGGGINASGSLTLSSVTIDHNIAIASGGGLSATTLAATGIVVTDNNAHDEGGGIYVSGNFQTVSIAGSVVSRNVAQGGAGGGGIRALQGSSSTLTITGTEVSENQATSAGANGGGLLVGRMTLTNSTISGNVAAGTAGGLSLGEATLEHVTVTGNSAPSWAGLVGLSQINATTTFRNTIVAGNGTGEECNPVHATLLGTNLQDVDGCFPAPAAHLLVTASVGLADLAGNGGPTRTHALIAGSAAVDGGTDCTLGIDQRRVARPVGASCDIGAYEGSVAGTVPSVTVAGPGQVVSGGGTFTISADAFNATAGDLTGASLELSAPTPATIGDGATKTVGALAAVHTASRTWSVTTPDVCSTTTLTFTVLLDWTGRTGARPQATVDVILTGHCQHLSGVVRDENGTTVQGATVTLCRFVDGAAGTPCYTATSGLGGAYALDGVEPGSYQAVVHPAADDTSSAPLTWGVIPATRDGNTTQDFAFSHRRTAGAVGATISVSNGRVTPDGTPSIPRSGTIFRWNGTNCADSPRVQFTIADGVETFYGPVDMHAVNAGTIPTIWEIEVPRLDRGGWATIRLTIECFGHPGGVVILDVYIDPSGFVRDTDGSPVEGATVTLYSAPSATGPWTVVPDGSTIMSPNNRTNPDTTTATGYFGWDVAAGFYKVVAEKAGCGSVESRVMQVPPPVTDLDLRLACAHASSAASSGGGGGGGASPAAVTPAATGAKAAPAPVATAAALALSSGRARLASKRITATLHLSAPAAVTVRVLRGTKAVSLARGSTVGGSATGRARTAITVQAKAGVLPLVLRVGKLSGSLKLVATATAGGVTRTVAVAVKR